MLPQRSHHILERCPSCHWELLVRQECPSRKANLQPYQFLPFVPTINRCDAFTLNPVFPWLLSWIYLRSNRWPFRRFKSCCFSIILGHPANYANYSKAPKKATQCYSTDYQLQQCYQVNSGETDKCTITAFVLRIHVISNDTIIIVICSGMFFYTIILLLTYDTAVIPFTITGALLTCNACYDFKWRMYICNSQMVAGFSFTSTFWK